MVTLIGQMVKKQVFPNPANLMKQSQLFTSLFASDTNAKTSFERNVLGVFYAIP